MANKERRDFWVNTIGMFCSDGTDEADVRVREIGQGLIPLEVVEKLVGALEKISNGGVDFGVSADTTERMLTMCQLSLQALADYKKYREGV